MAEMYLIVGLGNPGKEYANTRHNVGFMTLDALARKYGLSFGKKEKKADTASGMIAGRKVLLAKPQTYMNLSGEAVRGLMDFYKIPRENLLVISDDLDIPLGTLRLRPGGSAGGQRGLKSIIQHIGSQEFNRVRFGIGRPPGKMDPSDYVLQAFKGDDEILAQEVIDRAIKAIETWLTEGMDEAMNKHNGAGEQPKKQSQKTSPENNLP
jgi:peptidyl-tRNA hydrolase, PTH1 family